METKQFSPSFFYTASLVIYLEIINLFLKIKTQERKINLLNTLKIISITTQLSNHELRN